MGDNLMESLYYKCAKCHGNCDEGELVGGICHECRMKAEQNRKRLNIPEQMKSAKFRQMEIGEYYNRMNVR